jgi:hypothetical protein
MVWDAFHAQTILPISIYNTVIANIAIRELPTMLQRVSASAIQETE